MTGLAYIGRIIAIAPIDGADRIRQATVVCGVGGKWAGIVRNGEYSIGDLCQVYLQDAVLPETAEYEFMRKHKFRVRMVRLRGAPSECLIMPKAVEGNVGADITQELGVTKYEKPLPASLSGIALGAFPSFIPKTDEINFQAVPHLVDALKGRPYYITEKADGTSTTAYRRGDHFGVCSRNLELKESESNTLWLIAKEYRLDKIIPDNTAYQWETVGPGIQGNPMGLAKPEPRLFNVYRIDTHEYGTLEEIGRVDMPMVSLIERGGSFAYRDSDELRERAEGRYPCGAQREGIVIRSLVEQRISGDRLSFKVINLKYKDSE